MININGLEFFTATNLNWLHILKNDHHKDILIEAFKRRVDKHEVSINAFVIMPNHFHVIWKVHDHIIRGDFQRDLMKFTSRSLMKFMFMNDDQILRQLEVKAADRKRQVWKRNSLAIELTTDFMFKQKLEYIHNNPIQPKWKLSTLPENYVYSSAEFYESGIDRFNILKDFRD